MKLEIIDMSGKFEVIGNITLEKTEMAKDLFNYLVDSHNEIMILIKK